MRQWYSSNIGATAHILSSCGKHFACSVPQLMLEFHGCCCSVLFICRPWFGWNERFEDALVQKSSCRMACDRVWWYWSKQPNASLCSEKRYYPHGSEDAVSHFTRQRYYEASDEGFVFFFFFFSFRFSLRHDLLILERKLLRYTTLWLHWVVRCPFHHRQR